VTQGNSKALAAAAAGPTTLLGLGLRASSKGLDEQVSVQGYCVCIASRPAQQATCSKLLWNSHFRHEPQDS
jgi:hypothetical protein